MITFVSFHTVIIAITIADIIMHEREKNQLLEEGVELTLKDLQSM